MNRVASVLATIIIFLGIVGIYWGYYAPKEIRIWDEPLLSDSFDEAQADELKETGKFLDVPKTQLFAPESHFHYFSLYSEDIAEQLDGRGHEWHDFEVSRSLIVYGELTDWPTEGPEWWPMRELDNGTSSNLEMRVRPNDEFLQSVWENDFDINQSLRNLDLRRPPVRAEIIIRY